MNGPHRARLWRSGLLVVCLGGGLAAGLTRAEGPDPAKDKADPKSDEKLRMPRPIDNEKAKRNEEKVKRMAEEVEASLPQLAPSILPPIKDMNAIDLGCVLRLAGVENPDILIARQEVATAQAQRLAAMAMILPNLNAGMNYDAHTGPLQQSSGNILKVNREAFYLGGGAGAVAAGTVGIPAVQYIVNISDGLFHYLALRYHVQVRQAESVAVRNQIFFRVTQAYMDLLHGQGWRYIALQNRREAHEIARLTAVFAKTGEGKQSDADRAAAELAFRNEEVVRAEQEILVSSARLAQLLNLPPTVLLHVEDAWMVPTPLVPDPIPLHDLILIAIGQRPELAARRAAIREAIALMRNEVVLPFSPTILAGYSAGTFGGGSNLIGQPGGFQGFAEPRFDSFAPREDIDVVMFWTAQNAGLGNLARYRIRRSESREREFELLRELNRVRNEVATAYAGTHARYAQISIAQRGVEAGYAGFREDYRRVFGREGWPIELLDNFRLVAEARMHVLDAVVNYDKAQFALFVALGQPPPKFLAKAVPANLVPPPQAAPPLPACAGPNGGAPAVLPKAEEGSKRTTAGESTNGGAPAAKRAAMPRTDSPQ
jgi:outer membrane protein TolC